jgi:HPt (histidine-containing phosphotransfer) domain-containing protein
MEKYYAERDFKNYEILVHALKSTSKMIGAMGLSELAASLEKAGNEGNGDKIRAEHEHFLADYETLTGRIASILNISEEDMPAGDDEVMEFIPG